MKNADTSNGIPVAPLLNSLEIAQGNPKKALIVKGRLLTICIYCVAVAVAISFIAKVLVSLINLVTNIAFFGSINLAFHSPANNHLGAWVIVIPAVGGIVVGFMALYGSKAIRGHGIPEAMEQILVNESNIKPAIALLKPLSSAIAIGTGGPFGAEGPIIATGGALGSTLGQIFKVTSNERKIILAAGATAGMSAIFGTPIAGVFLAIELLLFEFSPRAILPVALACITGAAGHHLLFESGPVFAMPDVAIPTNQALAIYSGMGIVIGFLSIGITKIVYWVEDLFEHLPIHWMWWPAIGGLAVGLIGFYFPHTLGVGYDNITGLLTGNWPLKLVLTLCIFKFLSWAIALGSGTSGGTLAPLLTMGGAAGAVIGIVILKVYPDAGINIPLAALIGMSAMFAGASRAYLTSIVFALEATMQSHALLPLLGACTGAYIVSFFLMENTIMTEKIVRRGLTVPDSFSPDLMQKMTVAQVVQGAESLINAGTSIYDAQQWVSTNHRDESQFVAINDQGEYAGIIRLADLYNTLLDVNQPIKALLDTQVKESVISDDSLSRAIERMSKNDIEVLPVMASVNRNIVIGVLSYKDLIKAYTQNIEKNESAHVKISLKRRRIKMMVRGKQAS
ncbi:chloride channel protein [Mucilaginibacter sp. dw_454]|uniref:chloride channel protein n=1 Tax=Mucilaginibacter sp. dw_454 TaxID=2720079 RepID=UPI001BD3E424|nr:chloride channel protein [Mucilaginibacter sp. dw_454]